ncbi:MAG: hypothetical protein GW808_01105 [Sphingomonadales bacterium]|nr:hypothetical protein [Sphingomonadales bacterium]NCO49092.1 hypothetical protein [Sphingomonadales bacterium]NCO99447.1 hypothetical protein [Sphingomonadales bacterium]NCP27099.1 hypothetical protein [Sphingomonadales bacterium]NCP42548.1 hypothetical protein [Sphingomonadales bacterium]
MKEQGASAVFMKEFHVLNGEAKGALDTWRNQVEAARPRVCAKETDGKLNVDEFLNLLIEIPKKRRSKISVNQAVTERLNVRHRCN